jgi:hypothetical protein
MPDAVPVKSWYVVNQREMIEFMIDNNAMVKTHPGMLPYYQIEAFAERRKKSSLQGLGTSKLMLYFPCWQHKPIHKFAVLSFVVELEFED